MERKTPNQFAFPRLDPASNATICIHHSGRSFEASAAHAAVFLRRVRELTDAGHGELVPLLHSSGLEILYVTAATPLVVHDSRDRSLGHPRAA
jgi:hypothetical protein